MSFVVIVEKQFACLMDLNMFETFSWLERTEE